MKIELLEGLNLEPGSPVHAHSRVWAGPQGKTSTGSSVRVEPKEGVWTGGGNRVLALGLPGFPGGSEGKESAC